MTDTITEEIVTTTVILDAHVARYIAAATLPAVSSDDVTPILTGVHFSVEDGQLRVASTDRYRVHTARVPIIGDAPKALNAIVPRAAMLWLSKNAAAFSRGRAPWSPVVEITFTGNRVRFAVREDKDMSEPDELTLSAALIKGKFPPVVDLVAKVRDAEAVPAGATLHVDYLASVRAIGDGRRVAAIRFTKGTGKTKEGPVYIQSGLGEAIIQPSGETA
jgi:hypothetical protein